MEKSEILLPPTRATRGIAVTNHAIYIYAVKDSKWDVDGATLCAPLDTIYLLARPTVNNVATTECVFIFSSTTAYWLHFNEGEDLVILDAISAAYSKLCWRAPTLLELDRFSHTTMFTEYVAQFSSTITCYHYCSTMTTIFCFDSDRLTDLLESNAILELIKAERAKWWTGSPLVVYSGWLLYGYTASLTGGARRVARDVDAPGIP
jgi:hypothetical protein